MLTALAIVAAIWYIDQPLSDLTGFSYLNWFYGLFR
jgi:hypothetical protein